MSDDNGPKPRRHESTQLLTPAAASRGEPRPATLPPLVLPTSGMVELHDARGTPIARLVTREDGELLLSPQGRVRVALGREVVLVDGAEGSLEFGSWSYRNGQLKAPGLSLEHGGETLVVRLSTGERILVAPDALGELSTSPRSFEQRLAVSIALR